MATERQLLEQWAGQNPRLFSGLKQAISGAEGTILGGKPGYNVMFGGGRFQDFSKHPDRVISSPGGYSSAAAGAYQFMPGTWGGVQKRLGLSDFSPRSQDLGMLSKVRDRLMPLGGLSAITKAGTLTPEIQAALAPEWASFPTASGKSYYGQPVKAASQIQKFFEQGAGQAVTAPPPVSTGTAPSIRDILSGLIPGGQPTKEKSLSQKLLSGYTTELINNALPGGLLAVLGL